MYDLIFFIEHQKSFATPFSGFCNIFMQNVTRCYQALSMGTYLWKNIVSLFTKNIVQKTWDIMFFIKIPEIIVFIRYIWWISEDVDKGLHRLDLNDEVMEASHPKIVLPAPDLGGLVLDPPNFQVLVADRKNNTMLAVSLDG